MIYATSSGSFDKTIKFLEMMEQGKVFKRLDPYGQKGVDALSSATPVDTGRAAASWGYQLGYTNHVYSITWFNTDNEGGLNIIIILQYGHGTGTGGWVEGRDFINPAIQPIFDKILEDVWRQVTNG